MNKCKQCDLEIKSLGYCKVFCSQSCSATYNNRRRRNKLTEKNPCIGCGGIPSRAGKKYCNLKCQQDHRYKEFIKSWLEGKIEGGTVHRASHYVRRYLENTYGNKCHNSACGWDWSKPCKVEVEHKDGNALNHRPENLMLICPNCHTNTPTYKNRNKGNGRAYRRQRYQEGKTW